MTRHTQFNESFFSYLAGLIDGEGCVQREKRRSKNTYSVRIRIALMEKDAQVLREIQRKIGGSLRTNRQPSWPPHWQTQKIWDMSTTKESIALLKLLLPYLRVKKQKVRKILMAEGEL